MKSYDITYNSHISSFCFQYKCDCVLKTEYERLGLKEHSVLFRMFNEGKIIYFLYSWAGQNE